MQVAAGQHWIRSSDGAKIVIEAKSDLMFRWWRVRSVDLNAPNAIDERTLLAKYHPDPADEPGRDDPEPVVGIAATSAGDADDVRARPGVAAVP